MLDQMDSNYQIWLLEENSGLNLAIPLLEKETVSQHDECLVTLLLFYLIIGDKF